MRGAARPRAHVVPVPVLVATFARVP